MSRDEDDEVEDGIDLAAVVRRHVQGAQVDSQRHVARLRQQEHERRYHRLSKGDLYRKISK